MLLINLARVVISPYFSQRFIVYRSVGSFVKGRWVEGEIEEIPMQGVINVAGALELKSFSEGDDVSGAMTFIAREQIYVTRAANVEEGIEAATSDKIMWRGELYKIIKVDPYADFGFYDATGTRLKGN